MAKVVDVFKSILFVMLIVMFMRPFYSAVKKMVGPTIEAKSQVGVLHVSGPILSGTRYSRALRELFEDKDIKAVVLKIDSPGGSAGSSQAVFAEIRRYKQINSKPVIAFVENMCASGAYYIAAASDYIITTPSAFVGSIGVFIAYPELKEFINYHKVNFNITQSGDYKTIGNPLAGSLSPEQKALLQSITNDTYEQFTQDMSHSRPQLSLTKVKEWANGKIFTGRQALKLGLIDDVGSYYKLIEVVKKQAGIENEIEWVRRPKKQTVWSFMFGNLDSDDEDEGGSFLESCASTTLQLLEKRYNMRINC